MAKSSLIFFRAWPRPWLRALRLLRDMVLVALGPFEFGDDSSKYVYKNSPESAIAHRESVILELVLKHKLTLVRPVIYGTWSGLREGLSFQDMLLMQRRPG